MRLLDANRKLNRRAQAAESQVVALTKRAEAAEWSDAQARRAFEQLRELVAGNGATATAAVNAGLARWETAHRDGVDARYLVWNDAGERTKGGERDG